MARGYVEITETQMRTKVEVQMGFQEVKVPGTKELVFQRDINDRYALRILSTIEHGVSRETGDDAIRVVVFDKQADRLVKVEKRVHRTQNALENMRERARELWTWTRKQTCPECNSVMAERKGPRGKFLGCTGYPVCKKTMPLVCN